MPRPVTARRTSTPRRRCPGGRSSREVRPSSVTARSNLGDVPAKTRSIRVRIQFAGQVYNDGLFFPGSGYVDNLSLTLSTPVAVRRLSRPQSIVPHFDHVFMIMMENSDYSQIVGSTKMPFV